MNDDDGSARRRTILGEGQFLVLVDEGGWEFVERARGSGVVAVMAVTDDGGLLLTEQYRPAVKRFVIDLPAGLIADTQEHAGEALHTAAARELEEETGFRAESFVYLTTLPTSPGLTSETVTLLLAEHVHGTGTGGGVGGEEIIVHVVALNEVRTWLRQQEDASRLIDPKVYAALWLRS
jgi:ADP-ribose pyrophosphatase